MTGQTETLDAWCRAHLGSAIAERFFGADHLSAVHGVRLEDGREVVLKVRQGHSRLFGCHDVHEALWKQGVPCPKPLTEPLPLSSENPELAVSAEEWLGEGQIRSGADTVLAYAATLALMIKAAPKPNTVGHLEPPVPWLWWDHNRAGRLWPPSASREWDPHRIIEEMPYHVLEAAHHSRDRLLDSDIRGLPKVLGHGDFEPQNCRWVPGANGSEKLVVHDWDSVVAMPEAILAGNAAVTQNCAEVQRLASIDENERYLEVYAKARGKAFTPLEMEAAWAASLWVAAYLAAFECLKEDGPGQICADLGLQLDERMDRAGI